MNPEGKRFSGRSWLDQGCTAAAAAVILLTLSVSPSAASGNVANGDKLAGQHCNSCHSIGGSGTERKADAGPQFAQLAKRTPAYLAIAINKPHDFMPKFPQLSKKDKEDLIAYIRSVK